MHWQPPERSLLVQGRWQSQPLVLQTRLGISCLSLDFGGAAPDEVSQDCVCVAGIPLKYPTESGLVPSSTKFPFFQGGGTAFGNHRVSSRGREGSRAPAAWGNPPSPGVFTRLPPHRTRLDLALPGAGGSKKKLESPLGIPVPLRRPCPTPPAAPTVEFAPALCLTHLFLEP